MMDSIHLLLPAERIRIDVSDNITYMCSFLFYAAADEEWVGGCDSYSAVQQRRNSYTSRRKAFYA